MYSVLSFMDNEIKDCGLSALLVKMQPRTAIAVGIRDCTMRNN
jgi:hypothetical protein